MAISAEAYLWFKSLHIIGVVVWFAGLFYLVRLFIYHVETDDLEDGLKLAFKDQYTLMEKRLANIITTPGMILAISMAACLLIAEPSWLSQRWMQFKLLLVGGLLIYHIYCYKIMNDLHKEDCSLSGRQLRALNELPTIILVLVVMLVVFKSQFPTTAATWFTVFLVVFMAASIQFYAKWRKNRLLKPQITNEQE